MTSSAVAEYVEGIESQLSFELRGTPVFGLSISHLLILFFVALLFGAKRLPQLGTNLGIGIKAFKDALDGREGSNLGHSGEPVIPLEDRTGRPGSGPV